MSDYRRWLPRVCLFSSNRLLALCDLEAAPQVRGTVAGPRKIGVTSAVSDESVAGDSGVYEPSEQKYELIFVSFRQNVSL